MPKDYDINTTPLNQVRRSQNAQDDAWTRDFLCRAQIGHLATVWDDQPFVIPISFWYDPERREIYFHGAHVGRMRANARRHERVCFEACEAGRYLPSNAAIEFGVQYESAIAFGVIRKLEDAEEKRRALYGLLRKYFPAMTAGREYRPITDAELKRTGVYAIAVESWSGKRNWHDRAAQVDDWPPLDEKWFSR